ncbi:MAG: hypothetical protein L0G99_15925, partial [Propionibacteriales bacterium]|nr:hypothetical protein [Propionibacteriales bacterium]
RAFEQILGLVGPLKVDGRSLDVTSERLRISPFDLTDPVKPGLVIDRLAPFEVVLELVGPQLAQGSPFVFTVIISLLGWVGVPGATAAQVVLLDKVFGPLAGTLGVGPGAWVVAMLFASKADTYGPFPNGNMVGAMGLARSTNLKNMMITGWAVLIPACIMYAVILLVTTGG